MPESPSEFPMMLEKIQGLKYSGSTKFEVIVSNTEKKLKYLFQQVSDKNIFLVKKIQKDKFSLDSTNQYSQNCIVRSQ